MIPDGTHDQCCLCQIRRFIQCINPIDGTHSRSLQCDRLLLHPLQKPPPLPQYSHPASDFHSTLKYPSLYPPLSLLYQTGIKEIFNFVKRDPIRPVIKVNMLCILNHIYLLRFQSLLVYSKDQMSAPQIPSAPVHLHRRPVPALSRSTAVYRSPAIMIILIFQAKMLL